MKVYRLERTQKLPIKIEEAWEFFSAPSNLQNITPAEMKFKILTDLEGEQMYPGQIINYVVSPILNIPMRWTTEIKYVVYHQYFVDEQRFGPYALWHHKHFFEPTERGIIARDIVDYALPFGIIGRIIHRMFVKKQLNEIFRYRKEALERRFGKMN